MPKAHKKIYVPEVQEYPQMGAHKGASPIYFYYPDVDYHSGCVDDTSYYLSAHSVILHCNTMNRHTIRSHKLNHHYTKRDTISVLQPKGRAVPKYRSIHRFTDHIIRASKETLPEHLNSNMILDHQSIPRNRQLATYTTSLW